MKDAKPVEAFEFEGTLYRSQEDVIRTQTIQAINALLLRTVTYMRSGDAAQYQESRIDAYDILKNADALIAVLNEHKAALAKL